MNAIAVELPLHDKIGQGDQRRPETSKASAQRKRKPRLRSYLALARVTVIVAGIGLATVIPLGWGHWVAGMTDQTTDNAYLRADTAPISSQIAGYVSRVVVRDYERVRSGDLLAEIDDKEYRAKVARAKAAVAAAEAAIRNVDSRVNLQKRLITQAEAGILAIHADRDRAAAEHIRQKSLEHSGWSSSQRLEEAVASIKRYEAQLTEKRAETEATRQQLSVLATEREQAIAELSSRHAELELAEVELGHARIISPTDGVVNASSVRAGQYVSAGTRVISVVPLPNVYVVANYKETQLEKVRVGQAVTVAVDMFPGEVLSGRVAQLSPAAASEFALLPPDNSTGNFTKVAQRLAVKIELTALPDRLRLLLRPGMSVQTTIHTDQVLSSSGQ